MTGVKHRLFIFFGAAWLALACQAAAVETPVPPCQVLISVRDQRLAVVRDGELVARYPVSTSRFGTGDSFWSYKTPLGDLRVCDKIGEALSAGAVIRHRSATGEVLAVNAPGRDPIVTRLIWLEGLQPQNRNARSRGIYIHGTPEERTIGMPMSWGCIRMRSRDVIKFFDEVPVGTVVSIIPDKLPHMHRYEPPKEQPVNPTEPKPAAAPSPAAAIAAAPPKTTVIQVIPHETSAPLPAIGEQWGQGLGHRPERVDTAALRAMKGSILLANLPGAEPEKPEDHRAAKTAPTGQ